MIGRTIKTIGTKGLLFTVLGLTLMTFHTSEAATVHYTLENVILDDSASQLLGEFSWTYDEGDFENGVGQFSLLVVPFTDHDHTDLTTEIDVGNSVEITLEGNFHDDGVDITLALLQPLTPDSGAILDLENCRFEIGGNGFHTGVFLSGSIELSHLSSAGENQVPGPVAQLNAYPNPFNPATTIKFKTPVSGSVLLKVYNMRGQEVATAFEGMVEAGRSYSVNFNGENLSSGTYFYRLVGDEFSTTQKMQLVK